MAKLQLPNGMEIILSTKEVLELMHECGSENTQAPIIQESRPSSENQVVLSTEKTKKSPSISDEELDNILSIDKLIRSIEDRGRPFSYSLVEEQIKRFGTYYTNHGDQQPIYGKIYRAFEKAKQQMKDRYGGKWIAEKEVKNGIRSTRYTLIEEDIMKSQHEEFGEKIKETETLELPSMVMARDPESRDQIGL